ncbi:cysteinyl leukotriene receptor 2 [Brachyhypopomus gauderio]|uniref:cysteinyl leukotriene receptor 2 n=1 Tax=Brachyhypopomus gauderio TaxID=698409 RepID=UPI004041C423
MTDMFTSTMATGNLSQTNQSCDNCSSFKCMTYTITYIIMFPVGFISNFAALFVFWRNTTKKSANTVFMTNLAISDICFSLTLPFRITYYVKQCHWVFPNWLCRWCVYFFYVNLYTSVLFLTGLSVLRYFAVVHPIRNKTLVTVRRANVACFCIWVVVALISVPFLLPGDYNKTRCFEPGNIRNWTQIFHLNHLALVLGFLIPFAIILVCYGCIVHKLFGRKKVRNSRRNQRKRSICLIALVLSTFLLCFAPYHVVRTVHLHVIVTMPKIDCALKLQMLNITVLTLCMASTNSCLNPLLYYFTGENFRTAFRKASRRSTLSSFNENSLRMSLQRRNRSDRKTVKGLTLTPTSIPAPEAKLDVKVQ